MEFINKSDKTFTDISSEDYRTYEFPGGDSVTIKDPLYLAVSDNGHRVFDASGKSHYILAGWVHLFWEVKAGQPNFVK